MTSRIKRTGGWLLGASALLLIGFYMGHASAPLPLAAQQTKTGPIVPVSGSAPLPEMNKRVVAYVYNNVPITREEFGDYLISRFGKERLPLYVNKRIIEMECAKKGIDVTPAEIDATILEDCKRISISKEDFIRNVLKQRYNKTLDEWREDVMKPRLLLAKLVKDQIVVDETELKQMYENRYGEKASVKIILWPKDQHTVAHRMYDELRKPGTPNNPDASWDAVATKQPDPTLASNGGLIAPIGRYSGSDSAKVEEIAFGLKVGDVSPIMDLPIGFLVVKRVGTIPAQPGIDFEKVKAELRKEVVERKLDKEVPKLFKKMEEEAKPLLFIGEPQLPKPEQVPQ